MESNRQLYLTFDIQFFVLIFPFFPIFFFFFFSPGRKKLSPGCYFLSSAFHTRRTIPFIRGTDARRIVKQDYLAISLSLSLSLSLFLFFNISRLERDYNGPLLRCDSLDFNLTKLGRFVLISFFLSIFFFFLFHFVSVFLFSSRGNEKDRVASVNETRDDKL